MLKIKKCILREVRKISKIVKLFKYVVKNKQIIILSIIAMITNIVYFIVYSYGFGEIAIYVKENEIDKFLLLSLILLSVFLITNLLSYLLTRKVKNEIIIISNNTKKDIVRKIIFSDYNEIKYVESGKLLNILNNDTKKIAMSYEMFYYTFITFFTGLLIIIYCLFINTQLILAIILLGLTQIVLISKFKNKIYLLSKSVQKSIDESYQRLVSFFNGIEYIISNSIQNIFIKNYDEINKITKKSRKVKSCCVVKLDIINNIIKYMYIIVIYSVSAILLKENLLDIKEFVIINSLQGIIASLFVSYSEFLVKIQDGLVSLNRIDELILNTSIENNIEKKTNKDVCYDIVFNNVSFGYKDNFVLNNANWYVKKNSNNLIVGKNGIGKSTILRLLTKFEICKTGEIYVNNVNIYNFSQNEIMKLITYIPQETYLFNDTIINNLKISNENIDERTIVEVCKKARIHEFIMSLPNKYQTVVEKNGNNFSAGQKKRLAIARAFIVEKPIIIVDEVTSSLDDQTASEILNEILKMARDKTLIFITHTPEIYTDIDEIFEVNDMQITKVK